jgi:small subunit ribosomal protein S20
MPNTKSAAKAMRQSEKRRAINNKVKDQVKRSVKEVKRLIKTGDKEKAAELMKKAMSALDKAAKKGVVHKNTASRKKSRLAKSLAK